MSRVIAISMVKNEADVIESFVRHTLSFVDEMLIAEHSSTDKTPEILEKLRAEGLPITVRRLYAAGYVQIETMNALLREAAVDKQADIIMPLDADEFLLNTESTLSLRDAVHTLDTQKLYCLPWRIYEPIEPYKSEKFLLSEPLRRGITNDHGQKVIIGGALYRSRPFCLAQGSHYCYWPTPDGEAGVPWDMTTLHIAHFPWRSNEQYLCKIRTLWLNSIAKYSLHTPTAALTPRYKKIVEGKGEGCTFEGESEFITVSDRVELQELRYSTEARIDSAERVFEVGIQIAAARAEERMLKRHRMVTMVVPYCGNDKALRNTLETVYKQLYPYKEVFVLALRPLSEAARQMALDFSDGLSVDFPFEMPNEKPEVTLLEPEDESVFSQLSKRAAGDYVQWLFEGDVLVPDKLMKMVGTLELTDYPFALALCNGKEDYANWLPWGNLPSSDDCMMSTRSELWKYCLRQGKYPAAGIAGALFRRKIMEPRHWLEEAFLDGQPLFLTMWRMLLKDMREDGGLVQVAIIPKEYSTSPREAVNIEDWLWHQIEWYCLLTEEKELIGEEAYRCSLGWLKENSSYVEIPDSVAEALRKQYQEIIAGIE